MIGLVGSLVLLLGRGPSREVRPEGLALGGDEVVQSLVRVAPPSVGHWLAMSPAPFTPTSLSTGVWTGDVLLVWDHSATGAMFAYNPDYDRWIRLGSAPSRTRGGHVMAWTGREVLVWGGRDRLGNPMDVGWRFSSIGGWSAMAPGPLAARSGAQGVWDSSQARLVVWGGQGGTRDTPRDLLDGAVYDPVADTWGPLQPAGPAFPPVTDGDAVVGTTDVEGWRLDSPLAPRTDPVVAATGSELIVWGGRHDGMFPRDGARLGTAPP